MATDVLTIRIAITDRKQLDWLWENHMGKLGETKPGFTVTMLAWGDPYNEMNYILERVHRFLDTWDREELLEEMGIEEHYDLLEQLGDLLDIWKKEASKRFGSDVTHEEAIRYIKEDREREKRFKADREAASSSGEADGSKRG